MPEADVLSGQSLVLHPNPVPVLSVSPQPVRTLNLSPSPQSEPSLSISISVLSFSPVPVLSPGAQFQSVPVLSPQSHHSLIPQSPVSVLILIAQSHSSILVTVLSVSPQPRGPVSISVTVLGLITHSIPQSPVSVLSLEALSQSQSQSSVSFLNHQSHHHHHHHFVYYSLHSKIKINKQIRHDAKAHNVLESRHHVWVRVNKGSNTGRRHGTGRRAPKSDVGVSRHTTHLGHQPHEQVYLLSPQSQSAPGLDTAGTAAPPPSPGGLASLPGGAIRETEGAGAVSSVRRHSVTEDASRRRGGSSGGGRRLC